MFKSITLRGKSGEVTFGYRPAAVLTGWTVTRRKQHWALEARVGTCDFYQLRQHPLLFTAWPGQPDNRRGRWCFEVVPPVRIDERGILTAKLGPPLY